MKPILVSRTRFPGAAFARAEALFDVRITDGPLREACLRGEHADAAAIWSFGERVNDELLDALPNLRAVGNEGVGFDTIDVAALERRGIALCIPRGQNADAVADHAIALLLALRHQVVAGDRYIREGRWGRRGSRGAAGPRHHGHHDRHRRPRQHRPRGRPAGPRRSACASSAGTARRGPRPVSSSCRSTTCCSASDHVTLHCALADTTRGLLGARELALLRPTAVLINTARGAIVDNEALVAALQADRLWGAGLDVFPEEPKVDPRLLEHPRVVVTPHIADNQPAVYAELTNAVVTALEAVFAPR